MRSVKSAKKQKNTIIRLLGYVRKCWYLVGASGVCAAASTVLSLMVPIYSGRAIDAIITRGDVDFYAIAENLVIIGILVAFTALSQWLMGICNNTLAFRVAADIRSTAFNTIKQLPFAYLDAHRHGETISLVISDVEQVTSGLLMGFTQLFTGVLTIILALVFMFAQNWIMALVVLCVTPLSLFVAAFIGKHTYTMFKKQSETRAEQTALINEMVSGARVVQAFSYEDRAVERFDAVNEQLGQYYKDATFYSSLTNPSTRFINAIVYAAVCVFGAIYVIQGKLTVGTLKCFLDYANQYTKPFNEITGLITEFQNALACAGRIFAFIDEPVEVSDADCENLCEVEGNVRLEEVSFAYNPDKPLIEHLNLDVKTGQRIAIVGPTGCGKTTLINLLMRFYDVDAGSICVDGRDIREITRHSLRAHYGMVLQDTWLRTGTVRDNIAIGKDDATDEEIIEAARACYAHNFIMRLPEGYDTVLSDEGTQLSQGQRQLLCIARVMIGLPPMLILDEATSSIDTRTEMKIQRAFAKLMEGRTSFVIAHRLSTITDADVILVMRDGHIIEQGSHEELLRHRGYYYELYNSQYCRS